MKNATRNGPTAQGELLFVPIDELPTDTKATANRIVGHSETGHHHVVDGEATMFERLERDPLVCFLAVSGPYADIVHKRSFDTHETVRLPPGCYEVHRQAENVDGVWRQVMD